ncbi:PML-RARA-regulated adapter molecule 1 isoform X2 [Mirounga angustirostris]|uniref:PML-RARA-regulated adapter molecule 1 isoform X2 n=1 Tax=Mirounga angustirostris TaxID=9716 RepID=UPI00313E1551
MGSHQDFRSLQAKFQASQLETSEHPKKPPKPEFNKLLKKFPPPELSEHPRKPLQPSCTDLPKKPPKPEPSEPSKKFPQLQAPQKALQPEPVAGHPAKPPPEPQSSAFPKKRQQPEPNEATPNPSQPDFGTFPKKPPQPEFTVHPRKPPQPQAGGLPKKSLPQPEFSEVPQTPPWKPESSEPHPHSSQPNFNAFPKKISAPQLNDLPKKLLHPDFGDLTRRSSEPEVRVFPKRPRQSEFKAPSKKPLQPELGSLPRVSSEPEFGLLPKKFLQPESSALPKKHLHAEFFGDLPKKPPLPGSVSESSLPAAVTASRPRLPLSPGFGARQQRSGVPVHSGGSRLGLKPSYPPRRRPLPPVSSLGPPPAKPPLPPGPRDVQNFRRATAAGGSGQPRQKAGEEAPWQGLPPSCSHPSTALRRTRSSAGIHSQARQTEDIPQDQDEAYELYDDVEPMDSPSPNGRDDVPSTQQPPRPPQDPELRKEKAPQPQQLPPADPKTLKQIRKAEKAEREFRKKFKFEGEIVIQTRMMIDPNAKTRRGGGKHLGIRRGEILEVIEFTNKDEMLCRDTKGKYGYVPRTALLPLETEVYDDVGFWGM